MAKCPDLRPSADEEEEAAYASWKRPEEYEPIFVKHAASVSKVHREPGPRWVDLYDTSSDSDESADICPVGFNSVDAASNMKVHSEPRWVDLSAMPSDSAIEGEHENVVPAPLEEMRTETFNFEIEGIPEKVFISLEELWSGTFDAEERRRLCHEVFKAEVEYSLSHGIYRKIVVGNSTLESVTKRKTRNRHQMRKRQQRCIGLPKDGFAKMCSKYKSNSRRRSDYDSRQGVY